MKKLTSIILIINFTSCIFVPKWKVSMKPKSIQKSEFDFVGPTHIHWIGATKKQPFVIYAKFINTYNSTDSMKESQFCPPINQLENEDLNYINKWPCHEKPDYYLMKCQSKDINNNKNSLKILVLNEREETIFEYCFVDERENLPKILSIKSGKFIYKTEKGSNIYYLGLPFAYLLDVVTFPILAISLIIYSFSHGR